MGPQAVHKNSPDTTIGIPSFDMLFLSLTGRDSGLGRIRQTLSVVLVVIGNGRYHEGFRGAS